MQFSSAESLLAAHHWELGTIRHRESGHLPHWDLSGATYAATFRLADSVSQDVLEGWRKEREIIAMRLEEGAHAPLPSELERLGQLHGERIQKWLDQGHGECLMRDERAAQVVQESLLYFDGQRYDLLAWCVMPNHVHAVVCPYAGVELPDVLHSWKSFSAKQINKALARTGTVWMREFFDRIIRDRRHLKNAVVYVMDNPKVAGLKNWPWCGVAQGVEGLWK